MVCNEHLLLPTSYPKPAMDALYLSKQSKLRHWIHTDLFVRFPACCRWLHRVSSDHVQLLLRGMATHGFRRLSVFGFVHRALADTTSEGLGSRMALKLCTTPVDPVASRVAGKDGMSAAESSAKGSEWEEHANGLMVCTSLVSRFGNKWGKPSRDFMLGDSC